jgi:AraC-like DNA-binding protein
MIATPHIDQPSLFGALDQADYGVVLLDGELRSRYINRAFRQIWKLPNEKADAAPTFADLVGHGRATKAYAVPAGQLDAYIAQRIALVRAGNISPVNVRLNKGTVLRLHCTPLPEGGRMLSYVNITDLVDKAEWLEKLLAQERDNSRLSAGQPGDGQERPPPSIAPWQVRRVEDYIEANWDQPISVEDLAMATGASVRSIFRTFKQSRGRSPMEFAKQVRLQHAHELLTSGNTATSVTNVALACGFGDLGRFSKDYRQRFGQLPSVTLNRSKGT